MDRGAWALQRLSLRYCVADATSRGMRDFILGLALGAGTAWAHPGHHHDAKAAGLDEPGLLLYRSNLLGSDLRITNLSASRIKGINLL